MGIIDQSKYHFNCPKCKTTEVTTIFEKGSNWSASWERPSDLRLFKVEWKENQFGEPCPVTIMCKSCQGDGVQNRA